MKHGYWKTLSIILCLCMLPMVTASASLLPDAAYAEFPITYRGDVNGDSWINALDALMILQYSTGILPLSTRSQTIANVDQNKTIDAQDALCVLQYSVRVAPLPGYETGDPPGYGDVIVDMDRALYLAGVILAEEGYDISGFSISHSSPFSKEFNVTYQYRIGEVDTTESIHLTFQSEANGEIHLTRFSTRNYGLFSGPQAPKITQADYERLYRSLDQAVKDATQKLDYYTDGKPFWDRDKNGNYRLCVVITYVYTDSMGAQARVATPVYSEIL